MITLAPDATFPADVKVEVPGQPEPAVAGFTFRVLENQRYMQLLIALGFGKASRWRRLWERVLWCVRLRRIVNLADLLHVVVADWEGFDLPYSRQALQRLLITFPGVGWSILAAYVEARQGARVKN